MIADEAAARAWLRRLPECDEAAMARLERLVVMLGEENARQNLVSAASLAEVWRRQTPIEVRLCRRAMGITGDDVAALFKHPQVDPGAGGIWPELEMDLKGPDHGVLTVKRCVALDHFERHGEEELARLKHTCEVLDGEGFQDTATLFHPDMTARPLALPPRASKAEPACQWEFRVERP